MTDKKGRPKVFHCLGLVCVFLTLFGCKAVSIPIQKSLSPDQQSMIAYKRGSDEYQNGNYDKAVEEFTQAIQLNPKYAMAFYKRGDAFYKMDRDDEAINDFNQT